MSMKEPPWFNKAGAKGKKTFGMCRGNPNCVLMAGLSNVQIDNCKTRRLMV